MNDMRAIDRLDTAPRFTEEDAVRFNRRHRACDTGELLEALLEDGVVGNVTTVSSFGAESAVLLHLIARIAPDLPVLFLETGKHFPETLAYRDLLVERLGLTNLVNLTPDPYRAGGQGRERSSLVLRSGRLLRHPQVRPLAKALLGFDASLTGRKAFLSDTRKHMPRFEIDTSDAQGRLKINPLIDWDADAIQAYFEEHDLPRHPLVAQGYPSIGCSPCTNQVAPGEDPRSGRWSGWDKTECGIHRPGEEPFL